MSFCWIQLPADSFEMSLKVEVAYSLNVDSLRPRSVNVVLLEPSEAHLFSKVDSCQQKQQQSEEFVLGVISMNEKLNQKQSHDVEYDVVEALLIFHCSH